MELAHNKHGLFNYDILERLEAGLVLSGAEVKATKGGRLSLKGSYVTVDHNNEAWLVNSYIPRYQPAGDTQKGYDPYRRRKLLLHKRELDQLRGGRQQTGLTIIPTSVYTKRRLIKVSIALARGRSATDKRMLIKEREVNRTVRRTLRQK